jgi:hypothetical protein
MLHSLSRRIPVSRPSTSDAVAHSVMPTIISVCAVVPIATPNNCDSPALTWIAPSPNDVASPNKVPSTATVSTSLPGQRWVCAPSHGCNSERKASGSR